MTKEQNSIPKRMLIDAIHPEETRVAIIEGSKLSELDLEYSGVSQIKSNIYLAKVTRVEPSLQAAFVEFGNEKQGFLPFSEIHPDYFKIPVADKEALIAAEKEAEAESEHSDEEEESDISVQEEEEIAQSKKMANLKRQYKIQEVIKKHQIMLVQIVKEERGNKGAALTTYLSIAGRYCVLMPNSHQVGGISRRNNDPKERKRIKKIVEDLEVPEGISLIIRTAGIGRTKAEIKRDYDYLSKLWDTIRKDTMKATAPSLIYEEGDLVKKALRDLYTRDIEDIQVAGEDAYKKSKSLMKLMIPSHVRRIHQYKDAVVPLFTRYGVETQLDNIYDPVVQLPSGGYLVMNQTEALVSVDVNSGKANKQRNIEETALSTNKEAAVALARQLRLRDLAGLVVVDFIDMDDRRNNRVVENLLKEALKKDRARLQVGRISSFGLLEMSRQRLRSSVVEMSTQVCPKCQGDGQILSVTAQALRVLRAIEEEGVRNRTATLNVKTSAELGLYILNEKREILADIENRHHLKVEFSLGSNLPALGFELESTEQLTRAQQKEYRTDAHVEAEQAKQEVKTRNTKTGSKNKKPESKQDSTDTEDKPKRRRRRRNNRKRSDDQNTTTEQPAEKQSEAPEKADIDTKEINKKKPARQGRRKPKETTESDQNTSQQKAEAAKEKPAQSQPSEADSQVKDSKDTITDKPKKRGWWNRKSDEAGVDDNKASS